VNFDYFPNAALFGKILFTVNITISCFFFVSKTETYITKRMPLPRSTRLHVFGKVLLENSN